MAVQPEKAWQTAFAQLQTEMPKAVFDTWVRPTFFKEYREDTQTMVIGVPNTFARDWLDSRLRQTARRILIGILNMTVDVEFVVDSPPRDGCDDVSLATEPQDEASPLATEQISASNLNPRYTFDTFIVGPHNRLAHAASLSIAELPAKTYNPLFLFGGVGLGKTHLLQAIGNAVVRTGKRVLYITTEEFTNDLIQSIRTHTTQAFRDKYRKTDVLLIDDIQFIIGKEATQEEFFHTFNTLYGQEKQIVITSDRPPKSMVTLEDRLRSRFEWGLMADIQPPDLETRMAILHYKAEQRKVQLPDEVVEIIARRFTHNVRELEGAFNRVVAFAQLRNVPITMELTILAIGDLLPRQREVDPSDVVSLVSQTFGVSKDELVGKTRSQAVALPRQVAMYLLREDAKLSLPRIGELMGGRDHTTVMYACEKIVSMLELDNTLKNKVNQIRETIYAY